MTALHDRGDGVATRIGDVDLHLLNEGTHLRLYDVLGAHPGSFGGVEGTTFAVWAPAATAASVVGDWDGWVGEAPLSSRGPSGVWEGFVAGARPGHRYKYRLVTAGGGPPLDKADPLGFLHEQPPATASVIWSGGHAWGDQDWMARRRGRTSRAAPVSIYEVHLGSWRRRADGGWLSYRELAPLLADHVSGLGFTHVEILPVMEHPFYGSWGYQVTGYFAPSARYGRPEDLMFLVDHLHQRGIGVILDWVPSHFPTDAHGPYRFDGSHVYEHADPRQGFHPHWTSYIFNYGRHEVRSFLLSSALFWLDRFHADALRVDGVASMLYLDYGRGEGEWVPNRYGGHENLDAVDFVRALNEAIYREHPDVETFAEELTSWPGVTRPLHLGGLGFGFKWDLGWMHDTLGYLARDPIHRSFHHDALTFRGLYAFLESYVLSLSHDEVVHGKGSLLGKMPGDDWQQRANLRLLLAHQATQPGKKLLFMGDEFGQRREWNHDDSLDWALAADPRHGGLQLLVGELNRLYRELPALHRHDCEPAGYAWIDANDSAQSVIAYERRGDGGEVAVVVLSFTPVPREGYRLGVPRGGRWREALNTDAAPFGGSGVGNLGEVVAAAVPAHGRACSLELVLPPLGALILIPT